MADNLQEIVARVTAAVVNEMQKHEGEAFDVVDFKTHLADLAKVGGSERAWKVGGTYDTSGSVSIERASARAWKISGNYDTSGSPAIEKA